MPGQRRPRSQQPRSFHLIKRQGEAAALALPEVDGYVPTQHSLAKLAGEVAHPQFALREHNVTLDRADQVVLAPAYALQRKAAAAGGLSIRPNVPKRHV